MSAYRHGNSVRRVVHHLIAVLCPPDAEQLGIVDDIANHMGEMMAALPAIMRQGLIAGVLTYDIGAMAFGPSRGKRAHQLDVSDGGRYFDSWLHGPTPIHSQLAKTFMQLLNLGYYEHPTVQAAIGYTPAAWIDKVTKRRLTVFQNEITKRAVDVIAPDPLRPGVSLRRSDDKKGPASWR
jgi:hypothetical protein